MPQELVIGEELLHLVAVVQASTLARAALALGVNGSHHQTALPGQPSTRPCPRVREASWAVVGDNASDSHPGRAAPTVEA